MERFITTFSSRAKTTAFVPVGTLYLSGLKFWLAVVKNLTALRPTLCNTLMIKTDKFLVIPAYGLTRRNHALESRTKFYVDVI